MEFTGVTYPTAAGQGTSPLHPVLVALSLQHIGTDIGILCYPKVKERILLLNKGRMNAYASHLPFGDLRIYSQFWDLWDCLFISQPVQLPKEEETNPFFNPDAFCHKSLDVSTSFNCPQFTELSHTTRNTLGKHLLWIKNFPLEIPGCLLCTSSDIRFSWYDGVKRGVCNPLTILKGRYCR